MIRREFVGVGAMGLIACKPSRGEYFGSTTTPRSRKLTYSLGGEPDTLDPAKSAGGMEFWIIPALFEGLTQHHPRLPQPMAGLATHYDVNANQDRFTFYLRGHGSPRGVRLPDTSSLTAEYTRGQVGAPNSIPARWSDGRPITAQDFVFSWMRVLDPVNAAPMAYQFYSLAKAEEVNAGRAKPSELGVRALDDFTFQVDLRSPTPFFLQLITQYPFNAVPRQAIEAARARGNESSWTEPEHIVVSGPFTLRKWRRSEVVTIVRNPRYYDAHMVGLDELEFLPIADGTTTINLYRSGAVSAMPGLSFPPLFTHALEGKKDFHTDHVLGTVCPAINVRKAPLDNVLVRYALNMAIDKKPVADVLGAGRVPARNVVSPMPAYQPPLAAFVEVDGHRFNILAFDIEGARAMLSKARFDSMRNGLEFPYNAPVLPDAKLKAEILQQQWLRHLGIRVNLMTRPFNEHWKMVIDGDFSGVADFAFLPLYFDPNPFLDPFVTAGGGNPSGWTDAAFASSLSAANATLTVPERMARLADCERRLLQAMPVLPLYFDALAYLQKPFVRGLSSNPFDIRAFKYAWIDMNWRPQ